MLMQNRSTSGLWVDTRNANISKYILRYFKPILGKSWSYINYDKKHNILYFPNGSYLDFGSAEKPENLEGFAYDFMVVNEAGICLKKPDLWQYTLQPMTKNGIVKFIGTPKGKNLFHKLWIRGNDPEKQEWVSFKYTAYDSPFWTKAQLDEIRLNTPSNVFKQEFMGEFLDENAGVFRKIRTCLNPNIKPLNEGLPNHNYVMGVDLAKTQDFTVIIVIDEATKEVIYFERFNQLDWNFQKRKIFEVHKRFNYAITMIDESGVGKAIFDDLYKVMQSKLQGYSITGANKKDLIESLVLAIESQSIYYFDIPELLNELEIYEYNVTRSGNITYSAPDGFHDDCVIALALVWQLLREPADKFGFAFA